MRHLLCPFIFCLVRACRYTWKKSPGRKGEEAGYSYSTQRKYIQHFMKELGIDSRKATHVGRRHGAREAAIW